MRPLVADLGLGHLRIGPPSAHASPGLSPYQPAPGTSDLREAIAHHERVPVEAVAVTTGASMALTATLATLPRPASVLLPRPYYPAYPRIAELVGIQPLFYDLPPDRTWRPDPEAVAAAGRGDTKAIVINVPHNPTGVVWETEELRKLGEVARVRDWIPIVDEAYAGLLYDGMVMPDAAAAMGGERTVRVRSFSKSFGLAGERVGYVVAPPELRERIVSAHWSLAMSAPATAQRWALRALQNSPDATMKELVELLAVNRSTVTGILASCARTIAHQPEGGIFFWIAMPGASVDSRRLASLCACEAGVVVVPGAAFGVHDATVLRASFAVPPDELERGFSALVELLGRA